MAFSRAALAVLIGAVVPSAYAATSSGYSVGYAEYFSGIGSIYNQTTQQVSHLSTAQAPVSRMVPKTTRNSPPEPTRLGTADHSGEHPGAVLVVQPVQHPGQPD